MPPSLTLFLHGIGMGTGACLLILHALPSRRAIAGRWALFVFLALLTLGFLLEAPSLMVGQERLQGIDSLYLPFLPVSLWFYIQALVEQPSLRWWRHIALPTLAAISLLPLISLDTEQWQWLQAIDAGQQQPLPAGSEIALLAASIGALAFWLIWLALLVGYGAAMMRSLRGFDRRLRDLYADPAPWNRHRIRSLLGLTVVAVGLTLTDQVLTVMGNPAMPDWLDSLFRLLLLAGYGVLGLYEPASRETSAAIALNGQPAAHKVTDNAPRYAHSPLNEEDCARLMAVVERAMTERLLWRQSDLSLSSLATQVGVRPDYLSQALNTQAGCHFFDYVNRYRIEAACRQLRESDETILDIGHAVGFNAKSTFNAAFKRFAGQTPSQFRRKSGELET